MEKIGTELAVEALGILKGTKAFVLDQAPDFMRQVIAWTIADCIMGMVVGLALLIPLIPLWKKRDYWNGGGEPIGFFLAMSLIVPGLLSFLFNLSVLIKVYFAPKVFLLEYFASLVK